MKRLITIGAVSLVLLSSYSSSSEAGSGRLKAVTKDKVDGDTIVIFEDAKTKCQYMKTIGGYGYSLTLQPVLTKKGTPYCRGGK